MKNKIALLLITFNRPDYLKDCLWSLERADLSQINEILIVDDASSDQQTKELLHSKTAHLHHTVRVFNKVQNSGIKKCLLDGYDILWLNNNDIIINIDSDAIVRPDFIEKLLEAYEYRTILTGFHSITKNANGSERHRIKEEHNKTYFKWSVGGINICVDNFAYRNYVEPALQLAGNWDYNACIKANGAYCLKESVIQHIGFDSSMNHNEQPDIADDFYYWDLPDVTLIGVDSNKERLQKAFDICTKWIRFGDKKLLSPNINSKEEYSRFCIKELYKHINTSHMLVCQHDGYVHNWKAWDNDWLQYDYIGAPWYYMDGHAVGNGGFSLRSKRLMEIVATDENIKFTHPEDHHVCRTYRKYLENNYGIKFAPIEVAEKFSYEGYMQPTKYLTNQFGKHGNRVHMQKVFEKYVVNQFQGIGDILFLVPMIRALIREGNSVMWPIAPEYISIAKHFTDINMVNKANYPDLPYESPQRLNTPHGQMLPYRFASELMRRDLTFCMTSKYELYGHDWHMWRELYWERFPEREKELAKLVGAKGKYTLVNRDFGFNSKFKAELPLIEGKIIEMRIIQGYTLLDWCGIIEKAQELHTVNTSILYIIEILNLNMPIHLYPRNIWGEVGYEFTKELHTKPYILH